MPFTFQKTALPEVQLVIPKVFGDERGFFMETYQKSAFVENGIDFDFVQDNHSMSARGVLRGIHYQLDPMAQGKLVRVTKGAVYDIAVDLRKDSPNFKKWVGYELTADNNQMLYIPPGFGHGFCTLEDGTHFMYKCTADYSPQHEEGIRFDDPEIAIDWPISDPQVSERDKSLPFLKDARL